MSIRYFDWIWGREKSTLWQDVLTLVCIAHHSLIPNPIIKWWIQIIISWQLDVYCHLDYRWRFSAISFWLNTTGINIFTNCIEYHTQIEAKLRYSFPHLDFSLQQNNWLSKFAQYWHSTCYIKLIEHGKISSITAQNIHLPRYH